MHRIPGDLQQVVFNVAAQSSEHWTSLLEMYTQVTYDAEKRKMLLALASTPDVKHISWYSLSSASVFIFALMMFLAELVWMLLTCRKLNLTQT